MAELKELVTEKLSNKYQPRLGNYFQNLTVGDLSLFYAEDLEQMAAPGDKPLMRVCVDDVLGPYLKQTNPFEAKKQLIPVWPQPKASIDPKTLNLTGLVMPLAFASAAPSFAKKTVKEYYTSEKEGVFYDVVNFSGNHLLDDDLPEIAKAISKWNPKIVNLSNNRFHGYDMRYRKEVDKALQDILAVSSVKYVDITANPLASVDRKDLFNLLNKEQLKKLIWIPKNWINGGNWKVMIDNKSFHPEIEKTHKEYYFEC